MATSDNTKIPTKLTLIPLKDMVVFPYMVIPLFIGRKRSVLAVQEAMNNENRLIAIGTQKDASVEEPGPDDIFKTAVVGEILQLLKLPDGTMRILLEGIRRVKIKNYIDFQPGEEKPIIVKIQKIQERKSKSLEIKAYVKMAINLFEEYIKLNSKIPVEIMMVLTESDKPSRIADLITAHLILPVKNKQKLLETTNIKERLEELCLCLEKEIKVLGIEKKIHGKVKEKIEKVQKEYYLREQLKAIHQELGGEDQWNKEIAEIKEKILKKDLPPLALDKAEREIAKLESMSPASPESSVSLNYLEWLLELPWNDLSKDCQNMKKSIRILEEDHYGLEKPKERIIEFLAVKKLRDKLKGPILCFVGPPGVGKTSLGKSIARSLDRKFVRMSLGGVRDEAEIRGHRRTYIGSMPGRILQLIRRAHTKNPVFVLDEVDKMSMDFRGDPSAALLEVLDPEQNYEFEDHYINVPFDLSDVMFITTANVLYDIPHPLRDRMEIIHLSGYTEEEKYSIALKYLLPKEIENNGLSKYKFKFNKKAIFEIIRYHTMEAGVRNLQKNIASVLRKIAKDIVTNKLKIKKSMTVNVEHISKYLGTRKYSFGHLVKKRRSGVITGLAWTEYGGTHLLIEAVKMKGSGKLILTGQLGDVMMESAKAAFSYIKSKASTYNLDESVFTDNDIHIHVPEGGIPKDGPSAGITIATSLLSLLTETKPVPHLAMTGEITLTGDVYPIGGLKEKILASHRIGIKDIIIPEENKKNLDDVPDYCKKNIRFHLVSHVDEVFKIALPASRMSKS